MGTGARGLLGIDPVTTGADHDGVFLVLQFDRDIESLQPGQGPCLLKNFVAVGTDKKADELSFGINIFQTRAVSHRVFFLHEACKLIAFGLRQRKKDIAPH